MTETVMPKEILDGLSPNYVAPFTAYLCSETCQETGSLYEVAAGYICKDRFQQSAGHQFDVKNLNLDDIHSKWGDINQFESGSSIPQSAQDLLQKVLANLENIKQTKPAAASSSSAGGSMAKAEKIFNMMAVYLSRGEGAD